MIRQRPAITTGTVVRCLGGGRVGSGAPAGAAAAARRRHPDCPGGPGLVDGADGGAVFVFGQATFAFATDDEVGSPARRGAAGGHRYRLGGRAGFGIGLATLRRWEAAYDARSARTPGCSTKNASCSTSGSTPPPPRAAAVPYTPSASSSPRPEPATPTPT